MKKILNKIDKKPILITIGVIIIQSFFFFITKLFQGEAHVIGNVIDDKIPFINYFIIPYCIWYLLLLIVPYYYYKKDKDLFVKYITSYLICALSANVIFLIYPTIVIRPELENNNIFNIITNFIYWVDTPAINCFPSMHCAIAMLFIITINILKDTKKSYRILLTILSIIIMIATLCTKQHVFIDFIAGDILMCIVYIIVAKNKKLTNKVKKMLKL